MPDSQSDFSLPAESAGSNIEARWADIRLMYESATGWCAIYTCRHRGRMIVLKTLKAKYRTSTLHKSLLRKEYAIGSMMTHRDIVSFLGLEEVPGLGDCILMEYVDGITLDEYISSRQHIDRQQIANLIHQICNAVSYIHSRQMVHCDLKPSNILITRDGNFIKILDFGLCRGIGFDLLDIPGGTRGFTAPENMKPGSKATVATDIFSIGRLLEVIDHHHKLASVWRPCIAANPDLRPKSADQVLALLNKHIMRRKRLRLSAAVLGATILTAASFYALLRIISPPQPDNLPDAPLMNEAAEEAQTQLPQSSEQIVLSPSTYTPTAKVADTVFITNSGSDIPVGVDAESPEFRKLLAEKFEQVVGSRFKEHLNLIDTMTTTRSCELQLVRHWRWLAKRDMRQWLEKDLSLSHTEVEEIMKEIEVHINQWGEFSFRLATEAQHRADAIKLNPKMSGASTKYAYYNEMDELVVHRLGEDGVWREEIIKVPTNRLDPVETRKIKEEYMQKALED